ncbi:MAG: hypothetical protein GY849_03415, partial [Deltaproteobacteria bacterium]|nr:hypothetical protein [Deltaproteobacteria bacterium]
MLARLLAADELPQVVVSTVDLEARRQLWLHPETAAAEAETQQPRPELDNPYLAPRNELEQEVAEIWARILGLEAVGVEDNYFDLGGNSLLATQIVSGLRDTFQVNVSLQSFFEGASVANVAAGIEVARWAKAESGPGD